MDIIIRFLCKRIGKQRKNNKKPINLDPERVYGLINDLFMVDFEKRNIPCTRISNSTMQIITFVYQSIRVRIVNTITDYQNYYEIQFGSEFFISCMPFKREFRLMKLKNVSDEYISTQLEYLRVFCDKHELFENYGITGINRDEVVGLNVVVSEYPFENNLPHVQFKELYITIHASIKRDGNILNVYADKITRYNNKFKTEFFNNNGVNKEE